MQILRRFGLVASFLLLASIAAPLALAGTSQKPKSDPESHVESSPLRLMVFGDSLAHGYGLPAADGFPAQLEKALLEKGYRLQVINAGNSGDTTRAGLDRLAWALHEKPDAIIVILGGNDALRGLDPERSFENLDRLLIRLEEEGIAVLLAGMFAPRNFGANYVAAFDGIYPRLAERHELVLYPFFLDGIATEPRYNLPDGIHPNQAGVAVIVERILPYVEELLAGLPEKSL